MRHTLFLGVARVAAVAVSGFNQRQTTVRGAHSPPPFVAVRL